MVSDYYRTSKAEHVDAKFLAGEFKDRSCKWQNKERDSSQIEVFLMIPEVIDVLVL